MYQLENVEINHVLYTTINQHPKMIGKIIDLPPNLSSHLTIYSITCCRNLLPHNKISVPNESSRVEFESILKYYLYTHQLFKLHYLYYASLCESNASQNRNTKQDVDIIWKCIITNTQQIAMDNIPHKHVKYR